MTDKQPTERRIEASIDLDAPVDAVWAALTDAQELSNWFPPSAEVKPGVGGHIRFVWDEKQDWTSPIGAWEPNKHLRVVWIEATPPEKAEQAKKDGFYAPLRVARPSRSSGPVGSATSASVVSASGSAATRGRHFPLSFERSDRRASS